MPISRGDVLELESLTPAKLLTRSRDFFDEINRALATQGQLERAYGIMDKERATLLSKEDESSLARLAELDVKAREINQAMAKVGREIHQLKERLDEANTLYSERQVDDARHAAAEEVRRITTDIAREEARTPTLTEELHEAVMRSQNMRTNLERTKSELQRLDAGVFAKLLNRGRRAEVSSLLRAQVSEAAHVEAVTRGLFESIAAQTRTLETLYGRREQLKSALKGKAYQARPSTAASVNGPAERLAA